MALDPSGLPSTVDAALQAARHLGVDRLDAQVLLSRLLERPRSWLIAHGDEPLDAGLAAQLGPWLERRAEGVPLAYLLGEKEFHGLLLKVSPDVLVPRPDTETLVDWALEVLQSPSLPASARVLDLGTGSGAIALAIKHAKPQTHVTALDASPEALAVARENARRLGLDIHLRVSRWWQDLPGQRFHLAVSNPPYIAGDDAHLPALRHEPRLALTPEGDGLDAFRDIIAESAGHLFPGGWLLLEHGHDQAGSVEALLRQHGFASIATRHDLAGNARCTGGRIDAERPVFALPSP